MAARALFAWAWSLPLALTWLVGFSVFDLVSKQGFGLMTASTSTAWLLSWGAILHFALVFPQRHALTRRWSRIIPLLYTVPFGFYVSYLAITRLFAFNTLEWLRLWRGAGWSVAPVYLIAAIIVVIQ